MYTISFLFFFLLCLLNYLLIHLFIFVYFMLSLQSPQQKFDDMNWDKFDSYANKPFKGKRYK